MSSSLAAEQGSLPVFRYHPDPVATGSVAASDVVCACCHRQRGFIFVGAVSVVDDVDGRVCPWCIADGGAARMFAVEFTGVLWRFLDVSATVTDEVVHRTPGFIGWQQERWLHHPRDAAEFHGPAGATELASLPDALESLRAESAEFEWTDGLVDEYLSSLRKDGQPTAYLFRCRHCSTHIAYSDFA